MSGPLSSFGTDDSPHARVTNSLPKMRRFYTMSLTGSGDVHEEEIRAPATPDFEAAFNALAHGSLIATRKGEVAIEDLRPGMEVISRERARAQLQREVTGLELERAQAQLEQRVIRSPLDGIVVARHLFDGEFLGTENSVVSLAQVDPLHVEAFLPVTAHPMLSPGMTLTVTPEAPLSGTFSAQVDVIDQVFDAASGTFGIRLTLPNPGNEIPAGHRCEVEVPLPGQ